MASQSTDPDTGFPTNAQSAGDCSQQCTDAGDPGGHILCLASCVVSSGLTADVNNEGNAVAVGSASSPLDCENGCFAAGDPGGHILCVATCIQNNGLESQVPKYTILDAAADLIQGIIGAIVPTWVWIGLGLVGALGVYVLLTQ